MTVLTTAGTESLGNEGVETDKDSFAEKRKNDKQARGDADSSDGFGGVRKAADHHGVDDHHAHPTDLGEDKRKREAESGPEFALKDRQEGHGIEEDSR